MSKNESNQTSLMSARNILRVLVVSCLAFAFCPSFFVSCGGGSNNIYVTHAIQGTEVSDSHPIMLLCYLIPIISFVILCIKKIADKKGAGIILAMTVIDIIIWISFRASVKRLAEANYATFETTEWYVFNMICMVAIVLISIFVAIGLISFDVWLKEGVFSKNKKAINVEQMSATVSRMSNAVTQMASSASATIGSKITNSDGISGFCPCCGKEITLGRKISQEDTMGYCSKCGSALSFGNKYCTSCGRIVPESVIEEGEIKKKELEEQRAEEQRRLEEERRAVEERRRQEEAKRLAEEREEQKRQEIRAQSVVQQESVDDTVQMGKGYIFCPHCGTKQDSDAAFCSACGKKID